MSKILNTIKNLFDLSKSDNENEAALALSKAKQLMDKYGIKDSDLIISNIKESETFACRGQRPPGYLVVLGEGIAKLFDCSFYNSVKWDFDKNAWEDFFIFVGFNPNQDICSYSFDVLSRRLKADRKAYLKKLRGKPHAPKRADAYALGWSIAVFKKVEKLVPKKEVKQTGTGLIPLTMIDTYMKRKELGSTSAKHNPTNGVDELHGYTDGNKVSIHKGMDYRGKQLIS